MKTPIEKTKNLVQKIFTEQHTDSGAKMILLSTMKIAHIAIDEQIGLCSYILQELAATEARTCYITKKCLEELIEMKEALKEYEK